MFNRFLSTLSVVSRIPIRSRFKFDSSRMDFYLPIAGICPALTGVLLFAIGLFFCGVSGKNAGNPALTAIIILVAQYLGFNLFHLDGLMDTADAFLGSADREKRVSILKDSRIGVYGFFAGSADLCLKAVLLYSLLPVARDFPVLVFAYPLWGRFSAALIPCMSKPLNSEGLGALLKGSRFRYCFGGALIALLLWTFLVWGLLLLAAFVGWCLFGIRLDVPQFAGGASIKALVTAALCMFVICPLTAYYYARLYKKSLGGYTGDALGAAIEITEVLCLAASRI